MLGAGGEFWTQDSILNSKNSTVTNSMNSIKETHPKTIKKKKEEEKKKKQALSIINLYMEPVGFSFIQRWSDHLVRKPSLRCSGVISTIERPPYTPLTPNNSVGGNQWLRSISST